MVERVLMQQMRLVDEKDGQQALLTELLDMGVDGPENVTGVVTVRQSEGEAQLPIEVAPTEGDVMAVGEAEPLLGKRVAQSPQHASLARSGLADERHVVARLGGVDQIIEQGPFARGQPQVGVVDLLAEGLRGQAEDGQRLGAHCCSSERRRGRGVRPSCWSSIVWVGSNATRAG